MVNCKEYGSGANVARPTLTSTVCLDEGCPYWDMNKNHNCSRDLCWQDDDTYVGKPMYNHNVTPDGE